MKPKSSKQKKKPQKVAAKRGVGKKQKNSDKNDSSREETCDDETKPQEVAANSGVDNKLKSSDNADKNDSLSEDSSDDETKPQEGAANSDVGKKRKSSGDSDKNDSSSEESSDEETGSPEISALQNEIKKMEQDHQCFGKEEAFRRNVKFFAVKFVDKPPRYIKSEYACIPSGWVQKRNPTKHNGERTGHAMLPWDEETFKEKSSNESGDWRETWDLYKFTFCYSTSNYDEAKKYVEAREELDKKMEEQNGGQKKPRPKPRKYRFNKYMIKVLTDPLDFY